MKIFPYPASPKDGRVLKTEEIGEDGGVEKKIKSQQMDDLDSDFDYEVDLPSHTKPRACLIVTKSSIYLCQTRFVHFFLDKE